MNEQEIDEQEVFARALELGPQARPAFLDEACGSDLALRQRVDRLLRLHEDEQGFFEKPAVEILATEGVPISEGPGAQIGRYKLLQQIGEGGMGTVFMAEQYTPIERRVAFKIIKPGMETGQVLARFEAERQALAMMDHPNIAKVLDAGATDTGRPFFVMELVKGIPITTYCDQHQLTVKERLELFLPVCQAIQHAHQKGIVHRDVKPSNVLVARYDGKPIPKVIDFGVAKATSHRLTEKTMFTRYGQIVGTVDYMSPEQAEFNQLDIDTRSDIYSLGVLLYELLTGETPFDKERLRSAAFEELLRILREEDPPRPSTRVTGSQALPTIAANRQTDPGKLSIVVRRELDWIVMKAMEKERDRRYETANGLAADLRRYLNDDPVEACPPSPGYRLKKFAHRNRAAFWVTSIVAVSLLIGVIGTVWQTMVATSQRDRAVAAEAVARDESTRARNAEAEARAEFARAETQKAKAMLAADEAEKSRQSAMSTLVEMFTETGLFADDRGDSDEAMLWFAHAARTAPEGSETRRLNRLRAHTWGRTLPVPVRAFQSPDKHRIEDISFHPRERWLLVRTSGNLCKVWDVESEQFAELPVPETEILSASWSPDGKRLALGSASGEVAVLRFPSWRLERKLDLGEEIRTLAFSPDGELLAYANEVVRVIRCETGEHVTPELRHPESVVAMDFASNGQMLATACGNNSARVFKLDRGDQATPIWPPIRHRHRVFDFTGLVCPRFVDDDRKLAVYQNQETVLIDVATGNRTTKVAVPSLGLSFLERDPPGRQLLVGGWNAAAVYNTTTSGEQVTQVAFETGAGIGRFRPDGLAVAIARYDAAGEYASFGREPLEKTKAWQPQDVVCLDYSPNGRLLATGQRWGLVVVWKTVHRRPQLRRQKLGGRHTRGMSISGDGRYLLPRGSSSMLGTLKSTRVYDALTLQPVGPELTPGGLITDAGLSPDGHRAVTASVPDRLDVWDWARGVRLSETIKLPSEPRGAAFSPDGDSLAVACLGGEILILNPDSFTVRFQLQHGPVGQKYFDQRDFRRHEFRRIGSGSRTHVSAGPGSDSPVMHYTPDGKWLITASYDAKIHVWNPRTGEPAFPPVLGGSYGRIALSADGKLLANIFGLGRSEVWHLGTGKKLAGRFRLSESQRFPAFSPDGSLIAAVSGETGVRVMDWDSGKEVSRPFLHTGPIRDACFTADGRWIVASDSADRVLRAWDWRSGRPVTPRMRVPESSNLQIHSHQTVLCSGSSESIYSSIYSWSLDDLDPPNRPTVDAQYRWAELISGHQIQGSDLLELSHDQWLERYRLLRAEHPELFNIEFAPSDLEAWHVANFERAMEVGFLYGARWHYERLPRDHPQLSHFGTRLAESLLEQNESVAAEQIYSELLAKIRDLNDYSKQRVHESLAEILTWGGPAADVAKKVIENQTGSDAITLFRDYSRSDPNLPASHLLFGVVLLANGMVAEAIEPLKRATELDRHHLAAHERLGQALSLTGQSEQAEESYRRALHLIQRNYPDEQSAYNDLAWDLAISDNETLQDATKAVSLARQAIALRDDQPAYWNTLGVALYRDGRWAESIEALQESIRGNTNAKAHDWLFLAMAHWQQGDKDEARRWYAKAAGWMNNKPNSRELIRFRREAAQLLGVDTLMHEKPSEHD